MSGHPTFTSIQLVVNGPPGFGESHDVLPLLPTLAHMRRDCPRRQRSQGTAVEHTEQPDMLGTFLLLHLLTRVAFELNASY